ncbi:MAG: hypothetical protein MUC56_15985 [Thermoanaerobaculales bacterium]|jgi:hypothetical protein|nr:hypothetical protein [Thermoanaerobaculales bacterium]
MFLYLLLVSFLLAAGVAGLVVLVFRKPVRAILHRIIGEEIQSAWSRYVMFAILVVGISGGVRLWELGRYITPDKETGTVLELTHDRWVLEIYSTIVGALQADTWMLLVFFLFALLAFVVVKGFEMRRHAGDGEPGSRRP